jgi:hypothetical protein
VLPSSVGFLETLTGGWQGFSFLMPKQSGNPSNSMHEIQRETAIGAHG